MILEFVGVLALIFSVATPMALHQRSELGRLRRTSRQALRRVKRSAAGTHGKIQDAEAGLARAAKGYESAQRAERLLSTPIEALRQSGVSNVRWSALEAAGVRNLADLKTRSARSLEAIRGVGPSTAHAVASASQKLTRELALEPVDLPQLDNWQHSETRAFARAAWAVLRARQHLQGTAQHLDHQTEELGKVWDTVRRQTSFLRWILGRSTPDSLQKLRTNAQLASERVTELEASGLLDLPQLASVLSPPADPMLEEDFRALYADYSALFDNALSDLEGGKAPLGATQRVAAGGPHRGLTTEVASRIEKYPLNASGIRLTLRRYQEFGAKYLLAQKRTVLGDEMGLGKTIQALAAMVHLSNVSNAEHFLVICPASIMENWIREISQRTDLAPLLLHGPSRQRAAHAWLSGGGVAVTSYTTLRTVSLPAQMQRAGVMADLTVVDEAHYAKNPLAQRSIAVERVAANSRSLCLMTGTPLENRLEEFTNIIGYASPEVASLIQNGASSGAKTSRLVAPVYLRRNQRDVLRELPERIEKEEWIRLSKSDWDAYRKAVQDRNYMAMRKATTIGSGEASSAKLDRLDELVDEYRATERKMLVFSFFLDVLRIVAERFSAIGSIRGAIAPRRRLDLIDRFQSASGHAVLVCQIEAGGVGVNLQAASVVVIMEPQWKPSTENQAIARAHRMGQTEHVVVHRMLASDSVDERMVDLLRRKQAVFDEHVRESVLKEASSQATERGFAKAVIEDELTRFATESGVSRVGGG